MTFAFPLALLGLLTLPVIIILHLIQRRRQRQTVSSLVLWRFLENEQRGPRHQQIPLTLLLILHLLTAALLTFALAQPTLAGVLMPASFQHTVLVVDTTTSMGTAEGTITRLDAAKDALRDLLNLLQPSETVSLIQMGTRATLLDTVGPDSRGALLGTLASLQVGGTGADLAGALTLANSTIDPDRRNRILVLSDGAIADADRQLVGVHPLAPLTWRIFGTQVANQALITFSSRALPDNRQQVFARVANYSNQAANRTLRISADNRTVAEERLNIAANGEWEGSWTLPQDSQGAVARLLGSDALPSDDTALLVLPRPVADTLLVSGNPSVLEKVLRALPGVNLKVVAPSAYRAIGGTALTVFDTFLPAEWPPGAVLVINPPAGNALLPVAGSYRPGTPTPTDPSADDPLLRAVDLSAARFERAAQVQMPVWASPVLGLADKPLIARGAIGATQVVLLAFDLGATNLPTKIAFPVLMSNILTELLPPPLPSAINAGQSVRVNSGAVRDLVVHTPSGAVVPLTRPDLPFENTLLPGLYELQGQTTNGQPWTASFAVNAGSALESDLRPRSLPNLQAAQPVPQAGTQNPEPRSLWPWFAGIAVAFLVLESLLAWK